MNSDLKKILVIEDNSDDQKIFSRNLQKTSFNKSILVFVSSIAEALSYLKNDIADLIFLDLGLPDGVGIDVLSTVLQHKKHALAIVLTGNEDYSLLEKASHFEISDFLVKSEITYKTLERSIRYALSLSSFRAEKMVAEAQLHKAMRMETIGRFAGGIAHDLNNKLAIISANLDLLITKNENDQLFEKRLKSCKTAIEGGVTLLKQLLAFGRGQELQAKNVDLKKCIEESIRLTRPLIRSDIELEFEFSSFDAISHVDSAQIDQVLTNLLVNSKDAIGDKSGKILIQIESAIDLNLQPSEIQQKDKKFNKISVSDTGKGMTSEEKQKAVEPFFTTKEVGHGTGLGLAVVDGIVSQHGGFIKIVDNEPRGTVVEIYLPVSEKPNEPSDIEELSETDVKYNLMGTVLLVDDEPELIEAISEHLRTIGLNVLSAENGESALNLFLKNENAIDMIITDAIMPKMGGRQLTEKVREVRLDVPVIFLTGYSKMELTKKEGRLPDNSILCEKPFKIQEISLAIAELLESKKVRKKAA